MAKSNGTLKVGDEVMWRGSFGSDAPKKATVKCIEVMECEGDKYGDEVQSVEMVNGRWESPIVVSLTNGHWARGKQISLI